MQIAYVALILGFVLFVLVGLAHWVGAGPVVTAIWRNVVARSGAATDVVYELWLTHAVPWLKAITLVFAGMIIVAGISAFIAVWSVWSWAIAFGLFLALVSLVFCTRVHRRRRDFSAVGFVAAFFWSCIAFGLPLIPAGLATQSKALTAAGAFFLLSGAGIALTVSVIVAGLAALIVKTGEFGVDQVRHVAWAVLKGSTEPLGELLSKLSRTNIATEEKFVPMTRQWFREKVFTPLLCDLLLANLVVGYKEGLKVWAYLYLVVGAWTYVSLYLYETEGMQTKKIRERNARVWVFMTGILLAAYGYRLMSSAAEQKIYSTLGLYVSLVEAIISWQAQMITWLVSGDDWFRRAFVLISMVAFTVLLWWASVKAKSMKLRVAALVATLAGILFTCHAVKDVVAVKSAIAATMPSYVAPPPLAPPPPPPSPSAVTPPPPPKAIAPAPLKAAASASTAASAGVEECVECESEFWELAKSFGVGSY